MPYVIETYDKPDHQHLRQATRAEHLAYLAENKNKLLACGAKLSDEGATAAAASTSSIRRTGRRPRR